MLLFSGEESQWIATGVIWLEDDFGKRYCITPSKTDGIKITSMDALGENVEQVNYVKTMHKA
jgi:hypothetical protein